MFDEVPATLHGLSPQPVRSHSSVQGLGIVVGSICRPKNYDMLLAADLLTGPVIRRCNKTGRDSHIAPMTIIRVKE
jgi:hypothetical protein